MGRRVRWVCLIAEEEEKDVAYKFPIEIRIGRRRRGRRSLATEKMFVSRRKRMELLLWGAKRIFFTAKLNISRLHGPVLVDTILFFFCRQAKSPKPFFCRAKNGATGKD